MLRFLTTLAVAFLAPAMATAQELQSLLQTHADEVASPSRSSVGPVLDDLVASGLPSVPVFLTRWQEKEVWVRLEDGQFFFAAEGDDTITLFDVDTGEQLGEPVADDGFDQVKPNGGVRRAIGEALVQFQLSDPNIETRSAALDAISRNLDASHLAPLRASIDRESDPDLLDRKERLIGYLTARFGDTTEARIAAIGALADDLSVESRAVLSQILEADLEVAETLPDDENIARIIDPGAEFLSRTEAYAMLAEAQDLALPVTADDLRAILSDHIDGDSVGGVPLTDLATDEARYRAYDALAEDGLVPARATDQTIDEALEAHVFYEVYDEDDAAVTDAAAEALDAVQLMVGVNQTVDLGLDAISLASIYFLAAIGLAITFGVMGVINMAHGEFIMMGAYTGYVVQLFITNYTLSLVVALPLAFLITFAAGVAMERSVIRWLYHRPLETLLATFGISIALQQLAKNIFGTQARPLTAPGWLDGAWVVNDVVQISYIRIAIFVLALLFLALLLFILKRTRLGLEVRAVTQNPAMAASMGINPDRVKMLTFGLGSGIAGIAGVAIGLFAKVTSEMGSDYIVQSFMTVVVGGVGNVWGTLAGAGLIGVLQKGIEWLNPSNTLAAQTYMILFIILFIQFRPKGIVALKGRAAED